MDEDIELEDLIERSEKIYEDRHKQELERTHLNDFVAIEPESGHYFTGRTLSEASVCRLCRSSG